MATLQDKMVYEAEDQLIISDIHRWSYFHTVDQMNKYVKNLMKQKWWNQKFPKINIVVKDGEKGNEDPHVRRGGNIIYMPLSTRCDLILLHEIAHCIYPTFRKDRDHNVIFRYIYMELVGHCYGDKTKKYLGKLYRKNKVDCLNLSNSSFKGENIYREINSYYNYVKKVKTSMKKNGKWKFKD